MSIIITRTSIAKNVIYNLIGYGSPLLFAIALIPQLIRALGVERFGILSIAWMVLGYFSLLDFGIGRSLTKIIAEKLALNHSEEIPDLFWTSLSLMLVGSFIIAIIIISLVPILTEYFNISKDLKSEALQSFYALAVSIPIIATTAALRGVLEAYQKFFVINLVRIFLGVFTFLVPIIVLFFVNSLMWVIVFMIFVRLLVWLIYLHLCFRVNKSIRRNIKFNLQSFKPVLRFSIWISIANIVGPMITYSDRIIIGGVISTTAITYYSTPYEVVTKLLLIPGALVGVLFPVFSASFVTIPDKAKEIFVRGVKYIFLIIYPLVFLIVAFAFEGIHIWLGEKFAENSTAVMQFLAIGILMNSLSLIPNIFFQSTGKPHVPTLLNLIELPIYILGMWLLVVNYGIKGAAFFYMVAAIFDVILMYSSAYKVFDVKFQSLAAIIFFITSILLLLILTVIQLLIIKIFFSVIILSVFVFCVWQFFLTLEEKRIFISRIRLLNIRS